VDIHSVVEVQPLSPIAHVPSAPDYLMGVINTRERIVPVVSIRARFGLPADPLHERTRIVLVMVASDTIGLLVDRVGQIERIDPDRVQAPPPSIARALANFFRGVVKVGDDLIMLVDTQRLLTVEEQATVRGTVGRSP
jgi:purine-binding chemotaxis protein CheW